MIKEIMNSEENNNVSKTALEWFNKLEQETKLRFITSQYQMHMSVKDAKTRELENYLTNEHNKKLNNLNTEILRLNDEIKISKAENDVLNKTNGFGMIQNQLKEIERNYTEKLLLMENRISNKQNTLETKLTTNYTKGIMGEKWIENTIEQVPNCIITDVTKDKGFADFYFEIGLSKGLIESKNVERMNKGYIERFKNDVIEAKNTTDISFAVFVAHRLKSINGKTFSTECLYTKEGNVFLFYVADAYNYSDRLLTAMNVGNMLAENAKFSENVEDMMYYISVFVDKINTISSNMKDLKANIALQKQILKDNNKTINETQLIIRSIIQKNDIKDSRKKLCISIVKTFIMDGTSFTSQDIIQRLVSHNVPITQARTLISRKLGGIKNIKKLAMGEIQKGETMIEFQKPLEVSEEEESSDSEDFDNDPLKDFEILEDNEVQEETREETLQKTSNEVPNEVPNEEISSEVGDIVPRRVHARSRRFKKRSEIIENSKKLVKDLDTELLVEEMTRQRIGNAEE